MSEGDSVPQANTDPGSRGPERLGAAEPDAAKPDAAEPGAAEPGAAEHRAAEPDAAEPGAAEPGTAEPGAAEPATAEASSDAPIEAPALQLPWRRLHPLSPLLRGGLVLLVIVGIVIANMRDRLIDIFIADQYLEGMQSEDGGDVIDLIDYLAGQHLLLWALLALLAAIVLVIGLSWLSWRFASFRITDEAVESRRGVLFKQHRRAPLERIQSVNLQRSLLARIVGLTQVDVQTGGQGGKVALQYLGHREAKLVREQILLAVSASKAGSSAEFARLAGAEHHPALTAVDYAGQAYSDRGTALDGRIRDIADFDIDPSAGETGQLIKVPVARLMTSILLSSETLSMLVIVAAIAVASIWATPFALVSIVPLALIYASILFTQFNRGFNFVLSRAADGVRIGAGLTSTTTETIPFGRVHAVEALQPLGWRPFGWWKVRITTAGHSLSQGGQNKLQNMVLPVGEVDDVLRVFETLLHGEEAGAEDRRAALQHALVGDGQGFLPAGPRAAWLLWFGRRRAGLRIEHAESEWASLRVRRGAVTRSLCVMPVLRAQSVQLSRPLMHRMLGLASLQAHTVMGPVRVFMRGISLRDARDAFDTLAATVVRVQGVEAERRAAGEPAHELGSNVVGSSSITSDSSVHETTDIFDEPQRSQEPG